MLWNIIFEHVRFPSSYGWAAVSITCFVKKRKQVLTNGYNFCIVRKQNIVFILFKCEIPTRQLEAFIQKSECLFLPSGERKG